MDRFNPPLDPAPWFASLSRLLAGLAVLLFGLWIALWPDLARASPGETDVTLQARHWTDPTGGLGIDEVVRRPTGDFEAMERYRSFQLDGAALWLRLDLPQRDAGRRWYLMLSAAAFTNRATLYTASPSGVWTAQQAGDHLPVSRWDQPDQSPLFALDPQATGPVWLRLENRPAPLSPRLILLDERELQAKRQWTFLMVGGYLGFGLLVLFIGWVHARLYADRAFIAYCCYVASMLGFQAAFTGIGGLFFWPDHAAWNDAAPAVFMLWLTASGIWFVREVCVVSRHHRGLDRLVLAWSVFGLLFPAVYLLLLNRPAFIVLNLYGLLSVLLSFGLCIWTWRRGETYAGWMALGFLPVHLAYPFPALRSAGVLPDSWATQYAVLIGSAIEIPLLLYILHRRAKDFSENRARLRAIESTDPLTGLTIAPVLLLRLRDALRRSSRYGHRCGLVLVELSNHADILSREGREAGDRALVVAASRLSAVVRDVDTVCRIAETRFALLVEGPEDLKMLGQHIVAKGLERVPLLPADLSLRFRLVSASLPDDADESLDDARLMERLHGALDRLAEDPRKVVLHLAQLA
ncbi:sensor domain-containing diguanylate cyclase [Hydrogenophaga sp. PBL-H3]|uniref:sensor domain-containing diguanylate cyclase n=1 Tax=Hydrogenophaga sp. PBL-H3 TaxID=434010 RepID=UPI00131FD3D8|nr:7TM diverse intracellular signaling domain-containing protein [Hydrogenophaga sp. PBL-H3]QHE77602.1 diguanylate cyclase [Hydrogenophaga sp. PBL-H3]QHE82026.1 diguanylate cyclase [Hydrogenophaga sp. PBL-H3]